MCLSPIQNQSIRQLNELCHHIKNPKSVIWKKKLIVQGTSLKKGLFEDLSIRNQVSIVTTTSLISYQIRGM